MRESKVKGFKIKKVKISAKGLQNVPRFLAEHSFSATLILILLSFIISGFIFYKYVFLADQKNPEIKDGSAVINEAQLNDLVKIWSEKDDRIKNVENKEYRNPFVPID